MTGIHGPTERGPTGPNRSEIFIFFLDPGPVPCFEFLFGPVPGRFRVDPIFNL